MHARTRTHARAACLQNESCEYFAPARLAATLPSHANATSAVSRDLRAPSTWDTGCCHFEGVTKSTTAAAAELLPSRALLLYAHRGPRTKGTEAALPRRSGVSVGGQIRSGSSKAEREMKGALWARAGVVR